MQLYRGGTVQYRLAACAALQAGGYVVVKQQQPRVLKVRHMCLLLYVCTVAHASLFVLRSAHDHCHTVMSHRAVRVRWAHMSHGVLQEVQRWGACGARSDSALLQIAQHSVATNLRHAQQAAGCPCHVGSCSNCLLLLPAAPCWLHAYSYPPALWREGRIVGTAHAGHHFEKHTASVGHMCSSCGQCGV